jgi:hypothetical protein
MTNLAVIDAAERSAASGTAVAPESGIARPETPAVSPSSFH